MENGYCLAIFPKKFHESKKEIFVLAKIQCVLENFKEFVAEELSTILPPLGSISQKINLMLRSSLKNKYRYQMTS